MIRQGKWKLIHYVGYEPQLFDIESDPEELDDLGTDPELSDVREDLTRILRAVCDPDCQPRMRKP